MDVGDPSNFIRIQKIFNNDFFKLKRMLSGYSYTDKETLKALKEIYSLNNYIADPHGAVGYLGLKEFIEAQEVPDDYQGIFLETAHPIKFSDAVESTLKTKITLPNPIKDLLNRNKTSLPISNYEDLKEFLIKN